MKKATPKISTTWVFAVLLFCVMCWAFVVHVIAKQLENPDNIISVITVIVLVFVITIYLLIADINKVQSEEYEPN
jgi:L-asparagine transporter-like permease